MPDFSVRATTCLITSAVLGLPPWTDPATPMQPTRLNVRANVPHRYYRVFMNGDTNTQLELRCTVGGVEGPADGALGGRLFTWTTSLVPVGAPTPLITTTAGFSSIAQVHLLIMPPHTPFVIGANYQGHYRVVVARPGSGQIAIPFDVEYVT